MAHEGHLSGQGTLVAMNDPHIGVSRFTAENDTVLPQNESEVVVVVASDHFERDSPGQGADEPSHVLPFLSEVPGEVVLEVACDDDLRWPEFVHGFKHVVLYLDGLHTWEADALALEGGLIAKVQVGDHQHIAVKQQRCSSWEDLDVISHSVSSHRALVDYAVTVFKLCALSARPWVG